MEAAFARDVYCHRRYGTFASLNFPERIEEIKAAANHIAT